MFSNSARTLAVITGVLLVAACTTISVNMPPVSESPTDQRLAGKVVWHDLLTHDLEGSKEFYGSLFGWEFESIGSQIGFGSNATYTLIRHDGRLIGGMIDTIALNGRSDISQWIAVMSVEDVDTAAARFESEGGEILTPPTDLQRRGRLAVVADTERAILALLETRDGDPADEDPRINEFLWDELWTADTEKATAFYEKVTGLKAGSIDVDNGSRTYRVLKDGDTPRVGMMPNPLEGLSPVWVSYLRVEDPADIASRVEGLGGSIIVPAQSRPIGGEVAFVAGPSGAGIALQTWPLEKQE